MRRIHENHRRIDHVMQKAFSRIFEDLLKQICSLKATGVVLPKVLARYGRCEVNPKTNGKQHLLISNRLSHAGYAIEILKKGILISMTDPDLAFPHLGTVLYEFVDKGKSIALSMSAGDDFQEQDVCRNKLI